LPVSVADFQLSGASQAKVQVSQLLKANVSGASEIRYLGSPVLDVTTSGSSFVRPD
jgi:Putative auto-transporter adhesin, head GIN domain